MRVSGDPSISSSEVKEQGARGKADAVEDGKDREGNVGLQSRGKKRASP